MRAAGGVEAGLAQVPDELGEQRAGRDGAAVFLTRLQTVGFAAITLHVSYNLVFTARKGEDSP